MNIPDIRQRMAVKRDMAESDAIVERMLPIIEGQRPPVVVIALAELFGRNMARAKNAGQTSDGVLALFHALALAASLSEMQRLTTPTTPASTTDVADTDTEK